MKIIVILLLIIIFWLVYKLFSKKNKIEGLYTFNGTMAIDSQYFYDNLFNNVFYYPNQPDGTSGWVKCRSECPGNCVEYGVTGNSYCFPSQNLSTNYNSNTTGIIDTLTSTTATCLPMMNTRVYNPGNTSVTALY